MKDEDGKIVQSDCKKGFLSDVWEIPYLNPKAKERVSCNSKTFAIVGKNN